MGDLFQPDGPCGRYETKPDSGTRNERFAGKNPTLCALDNQTRSARIRWYVLSARMDDLRRTVACDPQARQPLIVGVIRVIEDQITTLRPYNARYTGDHRRIFRKRYAEMITRVSRQSAHRRAVFFACDRS
jgi:hypothetical protein